MKVNVKDVRREARKFAKKIFNRKTLSKVLAIFIIFAVLASYVLPYIF